MVIERRDARGFFLIELLVVIAVMAVLIGLLLPNVSAVRAAAAKAAADKLRTAAQLGDDSYANAVLCPPPNCNSLVNNQFDVTLSYPPIPADIVSSTVLASGLRVSYDSASLMHDGQPFGLEPWTDNNVHDPGIVTMELLVYALTDLKYNVEAVNWLDGELDFIVRQPEDGQTWKLRALIAPETQSVVVQVPEPSSLLLIAAALLGLAVARRSWRCGQPSQHRVNAISVSR